MSVILTPVGTSVVCIFFSEYTVERYGILLLMTLSQALHFYTEATQACKVRSCESGVDSNLSSRDLFLPPWCRHMLLYALVGGISEDIRKLNKLPHVTAGLGYFGYLGGSFNFGE